MQVPRIVALPNSWLANSMLYSCAGPVRGNTLGTLFLAVLRVHASRQKKGNLHCQEECDRAFILGIHLAPLPLAPFFSILRTGFAGGGSYSLTMTNPFTIRPAQESKGDVDFILRAHDSAVRYLTTTVKSSQWGNELFSKRQRAIDVLTGLVRESEKELDGDEYTRTWIAERENNSETIPCGCAIVDAVFPAYVTNVLELKTQIQSSLDKKDFLYLDRLVSDRNAGELSKGVGKELLDYCKQICKQQGKRFLYSDCFQGPPFGLRQYYQSQGFRILGHFSVPNKHADGSDWPGTLLCFEIN